MENENCLEGIKCPKCGNQDRFMIAARVVAEVSDDGAEIASPLYGNGFEWDDDSHCRCPECERAGPLREFHISPDPQRDPEGINDRLQQSAPALLEALRYVAQILADFKPDYLKQIGLDIALERVEAALAMAEPEHCCGREAVMTETFLELTEDEFDARYSLVPNHLNPSATWVIGDAGGCLFETYGEELAFVRQQDPRTVWTLVDGDDGDMYLISGLHFVNRVGYLVSTVPTPDYMTVQVHVPMSRDDDDNQEE